MTFHRDRRETWVLEALYKNNIFISYEQNFLLSDEYTGLYIIIPYINQYRLHRETRIHEVFCDIKKHLRYEIYIVQFVEPDRIS